VACAGYGAGPGGLGGLLMIVTNYHGNFTTIVFIGDMIELSGQETPNSVGGVGG